MSANELRCSECGHGASFQPLILRSDEQSEATAGSEPLDVLLRFADRAAERPQQAFLDAPFVAYGLDDRWAGLRWFGGHGGSEGEIDRLELAHGDEPFDPARTQIRVETRRPQRIGLTDQRDAALGRYFLARELVERFFHLTDSLPDEIRRAAFPADSQSHDPTAPWADATIPVDGAPVGFKVLAHEDVWVALAEHDEVFIGIEVRGWPLVKTGLVTVTDLTRYEVGSNAIRSRRSGPPQP